MFRIISIICAFLCIYIVLGTAGASDFSVFGLVEISTTDIIQNLFMAFILFCLSYLAEFMNRAFKK